MQILAISKIKEGVTPDQIGQHGKNEVQHTLEGYLDGKILSANKSWARQRRG